MTLFDKAYILEIDRGQDCFRASGAYYYTITNDVDIGCEVKELQMDSKKSMEEETRKLTYVVIFMFMLVLVIFGLGPIA